MVNKKYLIITEKLKNSYPEIFTGDLFKDLDDEMEEYGINIPIVKSGFYNTYIDREKEFSLTEKVYDVHTIRDGNRIFEIRGLKWVFNFGQLTKMKIIFANKNKKGSSISIEFKMKDFDDNNLISISENESIHDHEHKEYVFSKIKCKFVEYLEKYVINSNSSEHHRKIAKVLLNMSEFLFSKDCVMGFIDEVGEKK